MRPFLRLSLAFIAIPAAVALAQSFQETLTVEYVEIPVTVIGRGGEPVRGLTKQNFEVFEDGQKRQVESFDAIDFASPETMKAISPLNPASRRNFLLLFDVSYATPVSIGRAQEAARNFIARSVHRRDLISVGVIDAERGFRFLTAFTTDRELLNAAIADPRNFRAMDPLQISSAWGLIEPDSPAPTPSGDGLGATRAGDEVAADLKRAVNQADDAYRRQRVTRQVESLEELARALQKLAGRKHLVLLSEGFDPRLVQGRMVGETKEQSEENMAVVFGEIWKVDSDKRFGNTTAQQTIREMAEEFRRSDVVLHAVDIQGVRVQNDVTSGARVNTNEGLFLLANSTGGSVFRNSNDISAEFDRLARQHEVVYVLGFRVPSARAGEFRSLKVKLVNVPGARVQHRGGYYAEGKESGIERALTTAEIIVNDIPQSDIGIAAMAAAFPTDGVNAQVPVIIEISGKDLVRHAKNDAASAEIYVYAFDEDGLVRGTLFERIRLDLTKSGERLSERGLKYYGTLSLPPGRYAIKNMVRVAESDRKGFQRVDLVVPQENDVAVTQPIFFGEAGDWVMVKGTSRGNAAGAPYPFVVNGESFIPAVRAELRKGEPRLFTVWVYNADPEELTWQVSPEAKLVSQTDAEDVTKLVFALERVPAGAKELGVTIRKKGSADHRRVSVPIHVR